MGYPDEIIYHIIPPEVDKNQLIPANNAVREQAGNYTPRKRDNRYIFPHRRSGRRIFGVPERRRRGAENCFPRGIKSGVRENRYVQATRGARIIIRTFSVLKFLNDNRQTSE